MSYIDGLSILFRTVPSSGKSKERITRAERDSFQHPHKRSCSRACQNKANYERHAEGYRQQRVENDRKQKEQAASS